MTLERPAFSTTKLTEGYDAGEVDDLVDRVFAALAGTTPAMSADDVRNVRFTPVRLRGGYTMSDVDDWLDLAAAELAARGVTSAPTPAGTTSHAHPSYEHPDPVVALRTGPAWRRVALALVIAAIVVLVQVYVIR